MPPAGAREVIMEGSRKAQNIPYKVSMDYDTSIVVCEGSKFSANPFS